MTKTKKTTKNIKSGKTSKARKTTGVALSTWGKVWRIALTIIVPLGIASIISLMTQDTMMKFGQFNQPPLSPPAILFPIAWTILYILMGMASYLIWKNTTDKKGKTSKEGKVALGIYAVQLLFNFAWTPLFFSLSLYWFAFGWLMVMWILIVVLEVKAYKISKPAFYMLLPYLIWCTFAAYLNCGVAILN